MREPHLKERLLLFGEDVFRVRCRSISERIELRSGGFALDRLAEIFERLRDIVYEKIRDHRRDTQTLGVLTRLFSEQSSDAMREMIVPRRRTVK